MSSSCRRGGASAGCALAAAFAFAFAACELSLDLDRYAFVITEDAGRGSDPLLPQNGGAGGAEMDAGAGAKGGASSLSPPDASDTSPSCDSCSLAHAEARCADGGCAIVQCVGPWTDANGVREDGCETGDVPAQGLTLWFMADRGVTQREGRASAWLDQSPNRYAAVQGVQAQMPALVMRGGLPMLSFDGNDDALALPSGFTSFSGAGFFAVVEPDPNELCAGILHFSNGPDVDDVEFGRHRPNLLYYEVVGDFVEGAPRAFEAGRRLLVSIVQAATGRVELRINGVLTGAPTVIPVPASVQRAQNYVGRNAYTLNLDVCSMFFRGAIGEVIFYPRELSVAERERTELYLSEKWLP